MQVAQGLLAKVGGPLDHKVCIVRFQEGCLDLGQHVTLRQARGIGGLGERE